MDGILVRVDVLHEVDDAAVVAICDRFRVARLPRLGVAAPPLVRRTGRWTARPASAPRGAGGLVGSSRMLRFASSAHRSRRRPQCGSSSTSSRSSARVMLQGAIEERDFAQALRQGGEVEVEIVEDLAVRA